MNVTFDQYLHERLPFDVGYRDDSMNSAKLLFAEGEKYSKYIEPKTMAGPTSADSHTSEREHRQQFIYLERRWPGEGGRWLPFLQFRFKNPIEGPVEVCYDEQKQDFVVTHNGEVAQRQSDESGLAYLAPVQRGTL